jgi:hypothetical protein
VVVCSFIGGDQDGHVINTSLHLKFENADNIDQFTLIFVTTEQYYSDLYGSTSACVPKRRTQIVP